LSQQKYTGHSKSGVYNVREVETNGHCQPKSRTFAIGNSSNDLCAGVIGQYYRLQLLNVR